jgi:hypothetical protein
MAEAGIVTYVNRASAKKKADTIGCNRDFSVQAFDVEIIDKTKKSDMLI